ncbi:MAG: hypothetical protein M9894_03885 [Planctomycetes bacterium]|nr:hypothetical protein [Planctomycetota bacterium]
MDATREKLPPRKGDADDHTVTAARSPTRCPYCHDACGPDDPRATVCQGCLSRHHEGCWREGGDRCASCGGGRALAPTAPEVRVAPAEVELLRRGLPREALERLVRRLGVAEAEAALALLSAASRELERRGKGGVGATVALATAVVVCFALFVGMIVALAAIKAGH